MDTYKFWHSFLIKLPKTARYTLGAKIDALFIEVLEAAVTASYADKENKLPWINRAITKTDMLKIFLQVLWETKTLDNKRYIASSEPLDEIGRMLGGWRGQVARQNSPNAKLGEK